jgi:hypothetical protein
MSAFGGKADIANSPRPLNVIWNEGPNAKIDSADIWSELRAASKKDGVVAKNISARNLIAMMFPHSVRRNQLPDSGQSATAC